MCGVEWQLALIVITARCYPPSPDPYVQTTLTTAIPLVNAKTRAKIKAMVFMIVSLPLYIFGFREPASGSVPKART
jgi:hypothetical protein